MIERVRRLLEYRFAENDGALMSKRTAGRIVKKVADEAGLSKQASPHVLRHIFSVNCIEKPVSTRVVQYF